MEINSIIQSVKQMLTVEVLQQIVVFVGVIFLAIVPWIIFSWLLNRILKRLNRIQVLQNQSWIEDIFKLIKSALHPLLSWSLGLAAVAIFRIQEWQSDVLVWLIPTLLIWLFYKSARTAVNIWVPVDRVKMVRRRIVFPVGVLIFVLYALGVLDNVLEYRAEIFQIGVVGLIFVLSKLPVEFVKQRLTKVQSIFEHWRYVEVVPLVKNLIPMFQSGLRPFIGWVLGLFAVNVFDILNIGTNILAWATPFFLIWFSYEVICTFLNLSLPEDRKTAFLNITRFIVIAVAILHAVGRLQTVWAIGLIQLRENVSLEIGALLIGGVIIYGGFLLSRNVRQLLNDTLPQTGMDLSLSQIISALTSYIIAVAGLLIALRQMRIDLTSLTVIIGGLSVGLGFALQDIIINFLTGFILLFEGSIGPGDVVNVDGQIGSVQEIGLRSMRIRTQDNVELIIPNANFLTGIVTNYSGLDTKVRVHIPIGVTSAADPNQAIKAIQRGIKHPLVLEDPAPVILYNGFSSDNHDFDLTVWINDALNTPVIKSELRLQIWDELVADDIRIPLPGMDLFVKSLPGNKGNDLA